MILKVTNELKTESKTAIAKSDIQTIVNVVRNELKNEFEIIKNEIKNNLDENIAVKKDLESIRTEIKKDLDKKKTTASLDPEIGKNIENQISKFKEELKEFRELFKTSPTALSESNPENKANLFMKSILILKDEERAALFAKQEFPTKKEIIIKTYSKLSAAVTGFDSMQSDTEIFDKTKYKFKNQAEIIAFFNLKDSFSENTPCHEKLLNAYFNYLNGWLIHHNK